MNKLLKYPNIWLITGLFCTVAFVDIFAQATNKPSSCANSDFSLGDFTNWVGHTSIYNKATTPQSTINNNSPGYAYYYTAGIVPGRQTIITTATPDPFTCGNVLTLPPGEKQCVRLGNGGQGPWGNGVGWQIDYLDYTFSITPSNSLLIYKYAVVLQNPSPTGLKHTKAIRPRFIVTIKDASGKLIDPVCGMKEDFSDSTVFGYRNCSEKDATALGGINGGDAGDFVYRAWTTVGVDLRKFIGQNITIGFETWDCGAGGHFGYAYLMAKCDSLGIKSSACSDNGSVKLTAPDGFAYKWLP
ncbi:MAG: hypothetical protein ABI315_09945, partial [Bacteroidia bacterium]